MMYDCRFSCAVTTANKVTNINTTVCNCGRLLMVLRSLRVLCLLVPWPFLGNCLQAAIIFSRMQQPPAV
jgi:hypothetical protein